MVTIAGRTIARGQPCFVIAEAGVNHNGDLDLARRLVDAAAAAGADAVKFQTFNATEVAAAGAPKAEYQLETTPVGESQVEMLRGLELEADAYRTLKARAEKSGLAFLSTPFDRGSVELLDSLGADAFKIASPDLTNFPLLDEVAARSRPVLLSTGLADLGEVEAAVDRLRSGGAIDIVLLHCVSAYPAPPEDANLRAMATMEERLGLGVGYSDHTEGSETALAAVALGAVLLEKHFTLDRSLPGPDQRASMEPEELAALVRAVRRVESALGDGVKRPMPSEESNSAAVRRSLAAADDLPVGVRLTRNMLIALRPATGISPTRVDELVGRRLLVERSRGELIQPDDLE
jgi:N-acetylneuraminate synthase/N,N'-diacetyllegionaminate synthase